MTQMIGEGYRREMCCLICKQASDRNILCSNSKNTTVIKKISIQDLQIGITNRYVLWSLLSKINAPFTFSPWTKIKFKILSYLEKGQLTLLNDEMQSICPNSRLIPDMFFSQIQGNTSIYYPCHKSFQPNCNFHVCFI